MTTERSRPQPRAFARPIDVDDVPAAGLETTIEATAPECAAVAAEIGLPAIGSLAGRLTVAHRPGGGFAVGGEVTARITQVCVVSLDPFDSDVVQDIDVTFAPEPQPVPEPRSRRSEAQAGRRHRVEAPVAPAAPIRPLDGDADPPDPIVDGTIDLGAVVVEFLTLALDLYPRKPGVAFTDVVVGEGDGERPSAFAALERLKDTS